MNEEEVIERLQEIHRWVCDTWNDVECGYTSTSGDGMGGIEERVRALIEALGGQVDD